MMPFWHALVRRPNVFLVAIPSLIGLLGACEQIVDDIDETCLLQMRDEANLVQVNLYHSMVDSAQKAEPSIHVLHSAAQLQHGSVQSAETAQPRSKLSARDTLWRSWVRFFELIQNNIPNVWDYEMDAGGLINPHPAPDCGKGTSVICGTPPPPKYPPHPIWKPEWPRMISGGAIRAGLCLFAAGILCCAGGIGGGGIYVTVLMVFGNLTVHDAIPLSKVVVFAASTPSLILNLLKSITKKEMGEVGGGDENEEQSLIDWNLCRVVIPFALVGTLMGVFLNTILPGKLIIGLLSLILLGIMIMLCRTGYNQHCQEREEESQEEQNDEAQGDASMPAVPISGQKDQTSRDDSNAKAVSAAKGREEALTERSCLACCEKLIGGTPAKQSRVDTVAKGETTTVDSSRKTTSSEPEPELTGSRVKTGMLQKVTPDANILPRYETALSVTMLVVIIICGTFHFWAAQCANFHYQYDSPCVHPIAQIISLGQMVSLKDSGMLGGLGIGAMLLAILYCTILGGCCVYRIVSTNQVYGSLHNFDSLGNEYNKSIMVLYIGMALLTGSLAGLVGIGGGLIFSPVFIMMKVDTHIAVATSATCVIFTSSSTTFQYLFSDRIIVALIISFCVPHLLAAYTGTKLVHYIQDNYGTKKSWITWIVALGVGLSMVLAILKLFSNKAVKE